MMTTAVAVRLPESLQALVDSRLDTIDRMLMGRVPRQDRGSIVREVEGQIFELLQERAAGDLGREDVLAVLARLDPPEAYLNEQAGDESGPPRIRPRSSDPFPARKGNPQVAKYGGILGLVSMGLALLSPVGLRDRPSPPVDGGPLHRVRDRVLAGLGVGYHGVRPGALFADGEPVGCRGDRHERSFDALHPHTASRHRGSRLMPCQS